MFWLYNFNYTKLKNMSVLSDFALLFVDVSLGNDVAHCFYNFSFPFLFSLVLGSHSNGKQMDNFSLS